MGLQSSRYAEPIKPCWDYSVKFEANADGFGSICNTLFTLTLERGFSGGRQAVGGPRFKVALALASQCGDNRNRSSFGPGRAATPDPGVPRHQHRRRRDSEYCVDA